MSRWTLIGDERERSFWVNGHEQVCQVRVECTYDECPVDVSFGSEAEDAAYEARFESGNDLVNMLLRVTARWVDAGATGDDFLGGCHVEARGAEAQLLELATEHGMIDNAVADLKANVERAVAIYAPLQPTKGA